MKLLNKYPMIKLDNGLNVVNYSSPHPYTFDTGEVLPMCTKEVSSRTTLKEDHEVVDSTIRGIPIKDVFINYKLQPGMVMEPSWSGKRNTHKKAVSPKTTSTAFSS